MLVVLMDYICHCRCQKLSSRALQDSGSSVWTNWSPVGRLTELFPESWAGQSGHRFNLRRRLRGLASRPPSSAGSASETKRDACQRDHATAPLVKLPFFFQIMERAGTSLAGLREEHSVRLSKPRKPTAEPLGDNILCTIVE